MWAWIIGGYAVALAVLIIVAGLVASCVDDEKKRLDAQQVLKIVLYAVLGSGGLLSFALALHDAGVI